MPGFFSFWPRKAAELVYPIPTKLRHWFGDTFMFAKAKAAGYKVTILNTLPCHHSQSSVTASNPEAYAVIEEDKKVWQEVVK